VSQNAAVRTSSYRASHRDNWVMAAVSQLAEFARSFRQRPAPGIEVIDTPRYQVQIIADFPIPGPNHVGWIRCAPDEVAEMVREVRQTFADRRLRFVWILDPDAEPPDLADRLRELGARPDPHDDEAAAMILAADAPLHASEVRGLEIRDALESYESFQDAEWAADEAFAGVQFASPSFLDEGRRRRFEHNRASPNKRVLLATIDGEPAGSASLTLFPPDGALMNGGAVRPQFRGLGIYRAMVAARMSMIREAGAAGAVVWGGSMSRPILETLGFQTVGWRRFFIDA
jgi:GNAT superfamily N-acetyltransferase